MSNVVGKRYSKRNRTAASERGLTVAAVTRRSVLRLL